MGSRLCCCRYRHHGFQSNKDDRRVTGISEAGVHKSELSCAKFHLSTWYTRHVIVKKPPQIIVLMSLQEIGWTHMRILEGVGTLVQLGAMIARLCRISVPPEMLRLDHVAK